MTKLGLIEPLLNGNHKRLTTRDFRENLAEALTFTSKNKGTIVLTKNGEERGVLISVEDAWLLEKIKAMVQGECDYVRSQNQDALYKAIRDKLTGDMGGRRGDTSRKRYRVK